MFSRLFKLGPKEKRVDLISHDSLSLSFVIDYYLQVPPQRLLLLEEEEEENSPL